MFLNLFFFQNHIKSRLCCKYFNFIEHAIFCYRPLLFQEKIVSKTNPEYIVKQEQLEIKLILTAYQKTNFAFADNKSNVAEITEMLISIH